MISRRVAAVFGLAFMLIHTAVLRAKTVTLSFPDNRTDVSLNLGDTLVVELSWGDVNGFKWVSHLPRDSALTALNDEVLSGDKSAAVVQLQVRRFRFNAAKVGDLALNFGFESADKAPNAAPQDASAYSIQVHIGSGAPRTGTAILFGTYKGTMPCADCSGLYTVLRLYAKSRFDTTYAFYVRSQNYRGAPHGDVTISDRGEWVVLRGDATDQNATVYQLNPDVEQSEALLVQDNGEVLVPLDRELKRIKTKMNVPLRRVSEVRP